MKKKAIRKMVVAAKMISAFEEYPRVSKQNPVSLEKMYSKVLQI